MDLELLKTMTFDNFDYKRANLPSVQQENLAEAYRIALDFAKSPDGWLVFLGVNGCGKTHLAAAIANYRIKLGKPVKFVVVPDLLDHLRSAFKPDSEISYDQLFEEVKNSPLLILDDLGEHSTTPWAREKLYQIINHRYNDRLPTVVTTQCSLDELDEKIEPAISSRLGDQKITNTFNIWAPDYRGDLTHKKQQRRSRK